MFGNLLSNSVFIIDGMRTPVGSPYKSLKNFSAAQLSSFVIKELLRRNKVNKYLINQVILGNAVAAGMGQNFARQASLLADLDESIPAFSVNAVCGSGLQAAIVGAQAILAQEAQLIVAGAAESATSNPFLLSRDDQEDERWKNYKDSLLADGLYCSISKKSMGDLVEDMVKKYNISREEQDQYALDSHKKACLAQQQNKFINEIVSVRISNQKIVEKDDHPRQNMKIESLRELPSSFKEAGTVTAGNASSPCDGAAAVLLASKKFLNEHKIKPKARIVGYVSIGVKPELTFESAMGAINGCLHKCHLTLKDIDLFEIAESFAAQLVLIKNKLGIADQKLNIWGGDIGIGHPLGVSGIRVLVTLLHALTDRKLRRGLACVSYGGGGAIAVIVERQD